MKHEHHNHPKGSTAPTILLAGSILLSSALVCWLPRIFSGSKLVRKYFPLANVFAGGVQLATIIVDLIPHMIMTGDAHHHGHHKEDLYPFIAVGLCFLALLGIETLFLHQSNEKPVENAHAHHQGCKHSHGQPHSETHSESLGTCSTGAITHSKTKANALLSLLGITVHSFLEGLSVEASAEHMPRIGGLMLHKVLESFAVGAAIHATIFSFVSKAVLIWIYSLLTPLAILLKETEWMAGISKFSVWANAMCLGALMFVVFFEVVGHSFHGGKDKVQKMAGISAGYLLGSVAIVMAHTHSH